MSKVNVEITRPTVVKGHGPVAVGKTVEVDEATARTLVLIKKGKIVDLAEAVEIPEDWESLHHTRLINMAEAITGDAVKTKGAAVAIIETEIERRRRSGKPKAGDEANTSEGETAKRDEK